MLADTSVVSLANDAPTAPRSGSGLLAGFGTVTGLGAILASSCCCLPLVVASLGAGASVFGVLETLVAWRLPLLAVSGVAVMGGWALWWRVRHVRCIANKVCLAPRRSVSTIVLLAVATAFVAIATAWPFFEPTLYKLMRTA